MAIPIWLEAKYVNLISSRLQRFRKVGDYTYTFRCPFCGDSAKNQYKTRGYIYHRAGHLSFKCHNCGRPNSIMGFIKELDPFLYNEFRLELLNENKNNSKNRYKEKEKVLIKSEPKNKNIFGKIKCVLEFPETHPARKYLDKRLIPREMQSEMYFVTRFMEWINTIIPDKFLEEQLKMDEPRLVMPFYSVDKNIFAVTGRSFKVNSIKYITIKFDENHNKIFGLDKIDKDKRVYIVEGPIDSLFIDNSIAFAGSSGYIPEFKDSVIILDNEPRNKEIVKLVEKFISQGRNVFIWPNYIKEKDINDCVIAGMSKEQIKEIIDTNTFNGLKAKLKFAEWRTIH